MNDTGYFHTPMQHFQFTDKYSRFNYDTGRRETWEEAINRTVAFLKELSQNKLSEKEYETIRQAMLNMEAFPSMRLFATAGPAARRDNTTLFNCSFVGIDSISSMVEVLALGMSGCGVGYSVEKHFVNQLPEVQKTNRQKSVPTYVIPDTTEGWLNAFKLGLEIWFEGYDIEFDFSAIRPAGAILYTKGGRASGPQPLRELLNYTRNKIQNAAGRRLKPVEVHDIITRIGDVSISGAIRRAALIALFDYDDQEMANCKNNGFWEYAPWRANANNSAVWPNKHLSKHEIESLMKPLFENGTGEPGIFNRNAVPEERQKDGEVYGLNPCVTGDTLIKTVTKKGTADIPIKKLAEQGDDILVFCYDDRGYITTRSMRQPRITGCNEDIYKVTFTNGTSVKTTKNHKFLVSVGHWIEVKDLKPNDTLEVCYTSNGPETFDVTVASVEQVGQAVVYNGTVDDYHNYLVVLNSDNGQSLISKNCGEIFLRSQELCNLSSAIARPNDTLHTLAKKVIIATIIGTIQSMATYYPNLRTKWAENGKEERLLGVDINGILDAEHLMTPENLSQLKQIAIETNKRYAKKLGINPSASVTCVKPSGNSSILFNTSSGIHARWSKYYLRRFRINKEAPILKVLQACNVPIYPEVGQTLENATKLVVEFPVKSPDNATTVADQTALEQLELWRKVKTYYTTHNPSCTISYEKHEIPAIVNWVYENQSNIGGLSFLPKSEHSYKLAPYKAITKEQYEQAVKDLPEIDWSLLETFEKDDNTSVAQELACMSGACEL